MALHDKGAGLVRLSVEVEELDLNQERALCWRVALRFRLSLCRAGLCRPGSLWEGENGGCQDADCVARQISSSACRATEESTRMASFHFLYFHFVFFSQEPLRLSVLEEEQRLIKMGMRLG